MESGNKCKNKGIKMSVLRGNEVYLILLYIVSLMTSYFTYIVKKSDWKELLEVPSQTSLLGQIKGSYVERSGYLKPCSAGF